MIERINFNALNNFLLEAKKILITAHKNIDGDGVGSSIGLAYALLNLGKKVRLEYPEPIPERYKFLLNRQFDDFNLGEEDLFLVLDTPVKNKTIAIPENKTSILIDHHIGAEEFCNYILREESSSTAEIIGKFLLTYYPNAIDENVANALTVGIYMDTGSLQFGFTTATTYFVMSNLIQKIDLDSLMQKLFYSDSREKQLLYADLINKLEIKENLGIVVVDEKDIKNIEKAQLEELINNLLKLKDISALIFALRRKNGFKISLRSKIAGINKIAEKFNGGGHPKAAGCFVENIKKLEEEVLAWLRAF